jgi:hypothetical protein
MAKTRVWPLTWPPVNEAIAEPTGPSSSPIMTSGSAAVPGGPPAIKASPVRITILSLIVVSSFQVKNAWAKCPYDFLDSIT